MNTVKLIIDQLALEVPVGTTILEAARKANIYIPSLCFHPDLPSASKSPSVQAIFQGDRQIENVTPGASGKECGICVVEVEGNEDLVDSCAKQVENGMTVVTNNQRIRAKRQENLVPIMKRHRHACLTCVQQEGCPRSQCSLNVPENERCCPQFGNCELQNVANHVGILDATPRWMPTNSALLQDHPLFESDYQLCIGCTRCVRACRDLMGVEAIGFVYDENDQVQIGTLAETLEASGCRFCTACVEVCPTGALADKGIEARIREKNPVPCKAACPVNMDIPAYVRMIAQGKTDQAVAIIREKVPFPGVLGRVCTHPCEAACRRGEVNAPISICGLKRYAADRDKGLWKKDSRVAPATGKKVAVVGAGPAGLTAAFYLRKQGHAVVIFDTNAKAGGMMRHGIPAFRLPPDILDREIEDILELDIEFKPKQCLGKDITLDRLKADGFAAVFLSVGAQQSRRICFDGCDTQDVLGGVEFLRRVAEGDPVQVKASVVVIGGGNLAVDAARTARRCGATDVKMACLECLDEMPATAGEIAAAQAEGIKIMPSRGPDRIVRETGNVIGVDLKECTRVFDDQGNFSPQFRDKKEYVPADQVIVAAGQAADLSFLDETSPLKVDRDLILVDENTLTTDLPGIYAGGDVASLSRSVIHAIAAGHQAAASIDKALGGTGDIDEVLFPRCTPNPRLSRDEGFAAWVRVDVPTLDVATRMKGFQEVAIGYSDAQAVREAKRCLQCDLRLLIGSNPDPPEDWLPFDQAHLQQVPDTEGVFQLFGADRQVLAIRGTANLRRELLLKLVENEKAALFKYEEDKMYTQRESELIRKYLRKHGEMPGAAGGLDELF